MPIQILTRYLILFTTAQVISQNSLEPVEIGMTGCPDKIMETGFVFKQDLIQIRK